MNIPETAAPPAKPKTRWLLLLVYIPVSCALIGWLSFLMGLENFSFKDMFWSYAIPRPGTPSILHLPGLAIGLLTLVFLILLSFSQKPPVTLFQARIVLLVLIAVLTLLAKVWSVVGPLETGGESGLLKLALMLFFIDIDLVVVFLMTFLPPFRRLKSRLV